MGFVSFPSPRMGRAGEGADDWVENTMPKKNTTITRKLRNNLTDAERNLWYSLRIEDLGYKFRRQAQIGKYIVDFVCYPRKLIIEVDGGQHIEQGAEDMVRDTWLQSQGFMVLRFWNNEVLEEKNLVVERIAECLK